MISKVAVSVRRSRMNRLAGYTLACAQRRPILLAIALMCIADLTVRCCNWPITITMLPRCEGSVAYR